MSKKRNKASLEIENKRKHLEAVSKKRKEKLEKKYPYKSFERALPSRKEKESFLIVCEGKNTESDYFNHFRLKSAKIKVIGEGYNTLSLVKRTVEIIQEETDKGKTYNQVWCVFDKDDFSEFNAAIILAEETHAFKVAYSNQAFEYWLILHFNDHQGGAMNRGDYEKLLNTYLKPYKLEYDGKGDKKISEDFFSLLQAKEKSTDKKNRQEKAIERAEKIYNRHDHTNPAKEESSTKVFLLVKQILENI